MDFQTYILLGMLNVGYSVPLFIFFLVNSDNGFQGVFAFLRDLWGI